MKKILKRGCSCFLVFIIAFCLFFSGENVVCAKDQTANNISDSDILNVEYSHCPMNAGGNVAHLDFPLDYVDSGAEFKLPFFVQSRGMVIDLTYTSVGFETVSYVIREECVVFSVKHDNMSEKSEINICFELENAEYLTADAYGYLLDGQLYISGSSYDDCFESYCGSLLKSGKLDEENYKNVRDAYYSQYAIVEMDEEPIELEALEELDVMASNSNTAVVNGAFYWNDDSGNYHPCQYVRVDVYDEDLTKNEHLGTTYTNYAGAFSLTFENQTGIFEKGCDLFIVVSAQGEGVSVKNSGGNLYQYKSPVKKNISSTGHSYVVRFAITDNSGSNEIANNDLRKAFQIANAGIVASRYAKNMNTTAMSDVEIIYPNDTPLVENCYYIDKSIFILGDSYAEGELGTYESWDVIMHEYGHHVQNELGLNDSCGGTHYAGLNCIDLATSENANFTDANRKEFGVKLAWAEGWATTFGIVAQEYYRNDLANIATVGDTIYEAYNGVVECIETEKHLGVVSPLGEGNELCVAYVLYDMYDGTDEPEDGVSVSDNAMWQAFLLSSENTLSGFASYVYMSDLVDKDAFGFLLAKAGVTVSTRTMVIYPVSGSNPPAFTWLGVRGSEKKPNNYYEIIIYNAETGAELYNSTINYGGESDIVWTPTAGVWNTILASGATKISWRIGVKQTTDYVTGPYYSACMEYEL